MAELQVSDYQERRESVPPFEIRIKSYRIGERYHCTVDNVSPGAVIARAEGATREEAEGAAVELAKQAIAQTRILSE